MTRTIAYMSYFSDFTYSFCIFQTLYMFLTAHSHHSSPAPTFKQSSRACHELCLTMEEEEVVAVGFPSPVDDLKVPDKQLVSSEWGTPWILLDNLLCKRIDCHYMQ